MEERSSYKSASFQVATEALSCFWGPLYSAARLPPQGTNSKFGSASEFSCLSFDGFVPHFLFLQSQQEEFGRADIERRGEWPCSERAGNALFRSHPTLLQLNNGFSLMSRARHLTFALEVSISLGVYTREPVPARNQYIHYRTLRNWVPSYLSRKEALELLLLIPRLSHFSSFFMVALSNFRIFFKSNLSWNCTGNFYPQYPAIISWKK